MSVTSLEFLLLLFLGAAVFFRLPSARLRQLAFTAGTAGFVYSYVPDPAGWAVLLGFVLSGYGCAELLRRRPSRVLFTSYIILLIATFAFLKKYDFLKLCIPERFLDLHLQIVGLSYILFRQIHFIVDVMQGQIERPALWAYINYQFNPFTLLAGPIQRYQDFQEYWVHPVPSLHDRHTVLTAYLRIFTGVIKVVVIAKVCCGGYDGLLGQLGGAGPLSPGGWRAAAKLILMLYYYLFYLYINFSRYCDIVIAGASLVGLRLPENYPSELSDALSVRSISLWATGFATTCSLPSTGPGPSASRGIHRQWLWPAISSRSLWPGSGMARPGISSVLPFLSARPVE
jgi:alginate O-acetyltransferase complex protein AlgI